MWEYKILGVDLYHVLAWFWVYSFLGWIWESAYVSVLQKKPVNRGFVNGPVLTLYGCGAVSIYLILRPLEGNMAALYFGGVIVATALEYVTGILMEKIFHAHWWDYSDQRFNFQGKICLSSSIAWGFFTLALFTVFQPVVEKMVNMVSPRIGKLVVSAVCGCYLVDFGFSAAAAFQMGQKLQSLEKSWNEFLLYLRNSRFTQLAEEMSAKVQVYRKEESRESVRIYLTQKRQLLAEAIDQLAEHQAEQKERFAERRSEQKEHMAVLGNETIEVLRTKSKEVQKELLEHFDHLTKPSLSDNWILQKTTKRYLDAYPHLNGIRKKQQKAGKKQKLEEQEKL